MFEAIRDLIHEKLVEQSEPSLAVAVAQKGQILWETGFGWADRENRIPANEHTLYSLASITKPMTATGLMILVERGQIDLDQPANDFLGEVKIRSPLGHLEEVTLRRIANHSSGLPLHYQFFYEDEPYRPPSMEETLRRYATVMFVPGERYQYSNLGYGVLDFVISRVSGKSYADFMREEVFLPLGMTHTSVHIGPGLERYAAKRYGEDGLPLPFYDFDHRGASAVFSSAHDLVRFGMFHLKEHLPDQKAILSDATIDAMQQPTVAIAEGMGYGIGWRITEDEFGYRTVGHSGGMGGVRTLLTLVPSERIVVVALANSASSLPALVTREILSRLLPTYAENRAQAEAKARERREEESTPSPPPLPPELRGKWQGQVRTYAGEIPFWIHFKDADDVHVRLGDQLETLLNEVSFKDGRLTGRFAGDIGTEDANRRPYHLHLALQLRGNVMNGSITAISLPGRRPGNALSYWVEVAAAPPSNAGA